MDLRFFLFSLDDLYYYSQTCSWQTPKVPQKNARYAQVYAILNFSHMEVLSYMDSIKTLQGIQRH